MEIGDRFAYSRGIVNLLISDLSNDIGAWRTFVGTLIHPDLSNCSKYFVQCTSSVPPRAWCNGYLNECLVVPSSPHLLLENTFMWNVSARRPPYQLLPSGAGCYIIGASSLSGLQDFVPDNELVALNFLLVVASEIIRLLISEKENYDVTIYSLYII